MATLISTLTRLGRKRTTDIFETDPDLRAVRDSVRSYVAASRAARLQAVQSERRAEAALRHSSSAV